MKDKRTIIIEKLDENYNKFISSVNDVVTQIDGYHNVVVPYLKKEGYAKDPEVKKYLKAFEEAKAYALQMLKELSEKDDVAKLLKEKGIDTLNEPLSVREKP